MKPAHKHVGDVGKPGQLRNERFLSEYIARKADDFDYFQKVNHPNFREASKKVHEAEHLLQNMGMSINQAREWIKTWASGAGDGSE